MIYDEHVPNCRKVFTFILHYKTPMDNAEMLGEPYRLSMPYTTLINIDPLLRFFPHCSRTCMHVIHQTWFLKQFSIVIVL